ncbi:aminotransferase class I/II-fold pyridoxal phosphate-dependent enzyme [bacterium]|nr:MAG: aminotransferase class I/II-fold pyridoxal phosphate-dependent enzyme [bacterium]
MVTSVLIGNTKAPLFFNQSMSEIKAIGSVYAYYYPEVRTTVDKVIKNFSQDLLLKSIFPGLDDYHLPLVEKFLNHSTKYQKGLGGFDFRYFVNGSSEAIFHLLVDAVYHNQGKPVYVFQGEYEGYKEYAKNMGGSVTEIDTHDDLKKLPLGRWFISNPSAINGNIIDNEIIKKICDLGHEVVIDVSYIGTTRQYQFDLTHPQIIAVLVSMSKPFGLFYYRIGIAFTRNQMSTLYPNKWFKNILSITIGEALLDKFGIGNFYKKYRLLQEKAVRQLSREVNIPVLPSDVLLLAYLPKENVKNLTKEQQDRLSKYQRGSNYRFCLTPYFLTLENTK